ncbi:MAG: hypothetical protein AB1505_21650 [Candidatus Latescibacterota bacterium]
MEGEIVERQGDGALVVQSSDGRRVTIQSSDISRVESVARARPRPLQLGIGVGVPYGVLGLNAELAVGPNIAVAGGIGTTLLAGPGYSAGLRFYLRGPGNTWRPRISAFYGTNCVIDAIGWPEDYTHSFEGIVLALGQQWYLGERQRHGMDLDLVFIATRGDFDDEMNRLTREGYETGDTGAGRVKISIGYRYGL